MSERMRYWQRRVAELESSGLSRAAFCRRRRINYQTMTSWVKRLRDESGRGAGIDDEGGPASGSSGAAGFVEVSLPGSPSNARPNSGRPDNAYNSAAQSPRSVASPIGTSPYEVLLGGDRSIRVGGDFDGAVLTRLIRVVELC